MGVKNSNDISLKVRTRFTPKKSCILLGRVSTKVAQRIVEFQILGFGNFFFVLFGTFNMVVNGE